MTKHTHKEDKEIDRKLIYKKHILENLYIKKLAYNCATRKLEYTNEQWVVLYNIIYKIYIHAGYTKNGRPKFAKTYKSLKL